MPVITVNYNRLTSLLGKEFEKDFLLNRIAMLGTAIEGFDDKNNELRVEVFPNRPDMLNLSGLARALKAFLGIEIGMPKYDVKKSDVCVYVKEGLEKIRPYIACAIVEGLKLDEEYLRDLIQLQEKLHETIGRRRKKVAIGLHDFSRVDPPIYYIAASKDMKFVPLDYEREMSLEEILNYHEKGKAYGHILKDFERYPLIVDANKDVLSFPPIINSKKTELSENTKDLFIDVTGTDLRAVEQVLNVLVCNLAEIGGKIKSVEIIYPNKKYEFPNLTPRKMSISANYVNNLLGLNLSPCEIAYLLKKMLYDTRVEGSNISIEIPAFRVDIMHAIDIVEDVAIAFGYENFKPKITPISSIGMRDNFELFCSIIREILIGLGFQEVFTFTLSNPEKEFEKMGIKKEECVEIKNPKTKDFTIFRKSIIPSILELLALNNKARLPHKIFEVGDAAFINKNVDVGAEIKRYVCCAISDYRVSFSDILSILNIIFENLGVKYELKQTKHPSFIEGRVANIIVNKENIGVIGEVHPVVLENFEIEYPVAIFEFDLSKIFNILVKH